MEDVTITEGTVTFDIRFRIVLPKTGKIKRGKKNRMLIDVEAQNDFYPGYPLVKWGLYY